MQLGIFAKTFDRPDVASCLQAVADAGIPATQFNLSVTGLPTIPDEPVPADVIRKIRRAAEQAGVALTAISGTFNAAHPDPARRQTLLNRFPDLCAAARDLQIGTITLSSGSRDPDDMWRWHPDNTTPQAWADFIPGATLCTVPSKDADPVRFATDIRTALNDFLRHL